MRFLAIAIILVATSAQARPTSLDIVTDCGATPDDGTDDTLAIRACLVLEPRELIIPIGVFDVAKVTGENATLPALGVRTSDTVIRGKGPGSVTRLVRDVDNFSSARVWGVEALGSDVERVVFADFTIDGGRGASTCIEVKHTPNTPPGSEPDGKGQQQHGIFVRGQDGGHARDVVIDNVNFVGMSGDSIFLYEGVEDVRLVGQTVGGYCRAGIAINAYTSCVTSTDGMRRITISGNTFLADDSATQGSRGIDVEPNAPVCDLLITDNITDEIETGQTVRMRIEGNTIVDMGNQLAGSISLVSANDYVVRGNVIHGKDVVTPPLYIRKSNVGLIEANRIYQPYPVEGIGVSNNGGTSSSDAIITGNRVTFTGAVEADAFAIRTQGVTGRLDVVDNSIVGLWKYAIHVYGGDDVRVAGNVADVGNTAVWLRSGSGVLETSSVSIEGNRGTALYVFRVFGAVSALRDCGNPSTGGQTLGGNTLTSCLSPGQQAANDNVEARLLLLESHSH